MPGPQACDPAAFGVCECIGDHSRGTNVGSRSAQSVGSVGGGFAGGVEPFEGIGQRGVGSLRLPALPPAPPV